MPRSPANAPWAARPFEVVAVVVAVVVVWFVVVVGLVAVVVVWFVVVVWLVVVFHVDVSSRAVVVEMVVVVVVHSLVLSGRGPAALLRRI